MLSLENYCYVLSVWQTSNLSWYSHDHHQMAHNMSKQFGLGLPSNLLLNPIIHCAIASNNVMPSSHYDNNSLTEEVHTKERREGGKRVRFEIYVQQLIYCREGKIQEGNMSAPERTLHLKVSKE